MSLVDKIIDAQRAAIKEELMKSAKLRELLAEAYGAVLHCHTANYPWQDGSIASRVADKARTWLFEGKFNE